MIRHLSGEISYLGDTYIVLDVGGVGYKVYVSQPTSYTLEDEVKLHTYHAIRETSLDLYGFDTLDELEIFELLLTLPKIGPKSAAGVMAQADIETIKSATLNNDPSHLSKMSGVGKKTAEKIVAGLKDKFESLGLVADNSPGSVEKNFHSDAIDALISLGYPQSEARRTVQNLSPNIDNANDAIKEALKELGSN